MGPKGQRRDLNPGVSVSCPLSIALPVLKSPAASASGCVIVLVMLLVLWLCLSYPLCSSRLILIGSTSPQTPLRPAAHPQQTHITSVPGATPHLSQHFYPLEG